MIPSLIHGPLSLSLADLDAHRFECADSIRDAVDSTDDTDDIRPLVYDTSISDEFEVQHEQVFEEYGEAFSRRETLYDVSIVPEGYSGRISARRPNTSTRRSPRPRRGSRQMVVDGCERVVEPFPRRPCVLVGVFEQVLAEPTRVFFGPDESLTIFDPGANYS